ncbi:MFS transporter [Homoserinibacter sp. YIM 151385]|uniref:MFS transporter n=1 Tax=Homoserinibacter sp. YIM 151385 TaxID=2985506 RepID=UPI0022F04571|nr:MFS transporter [Homoserinibacter sp. YIM 151385]WBU39133.1 MFS transporter [Homoserinibacter sp. YIM 151385]
MAQTESEAAKTIRSLVPARMDRLPWTRFHWMIVIGLGFSWILDGLEIQIVSLGGYENTLGMSAADVGIAGTVYLVGQVVGALVFGRLADSLGRKKLFILTLAIYLVASAVAGLSPTMEFFFVFRFLAGMGIGGEYAAINSAIDELIPSNYRGRVDIAVNGTYWFGAAMGSFAGVFLLDQNLFAEDVGWRIAFFIGPILGLAVIALRRHIPESPRWLITHGREEEAEKTVDDIEHHVEHETHHELEEVPDEKAIELVPQKRTPFLTIARVLLRDHPTRLLVGMTMMITQSFLYNAIFFTYSLVLQNFYELPVSAVPLMFFPFAIGNLLGPLLLGPLFDTWGRRQMIALTYGVSAVVLAISAFLFSTGSIDVTVHVILWCVSFFFASAGASSAYLTVSEIFPLEMRSQVISYVFAVGQIFGAIAPALYASLVGEGEDRGPLTIGYYVGAGVMALGAVVAAIFGVAAERKSLEDIIDPLTKSNRTPR